MNCTSDNSGEVRYSREGGNPVCKPFLKSRFETWIPAFAGMTLFAISTALAIPPSVQIEKMDYSPPPAERVVLKNGLVVYFKEDHDLPLFDMSLSLRSNPKAETVPDTLTLFSEVWRTGGTKKRSPDQLNQELENSAIGLGTSADFESLGITLSCLSHLKSQGLDIFVDVLLNPAFDKKQLAIAREGAIEGVRRKNDNINQIARRAFRDAVYGSKHPYAHEPSEKTLAGVKQQHLIDIHKKLVNPVGSVLTVTGDFNKDEMVKELETRFSSWKQNVMDSCSYDYSPAPDQKGKIIYVEKDFTQSRITIGRAGFARRDPDEYALKIADYILGGGGPSRLFNEVRSRLGLAYVVGSFVLPYQGPGPVGVGCQTKAGSTLAAIKAIKKIMAEMVSSAPSNEEVQLAKDSLINSYVFNFATASQIAGAYATSEFYGYSNDYVGTYIPRLAALTPMDIFAAAKKHYQWETMTLVVVGDQKKFDEPLNTLGEVVEIPLAQLN